MISPLPIRRNREWEALRDVDGGAEKLILRTWRWTPQDLSAAKWRGVSGVQLIHIKKTTIHKYRK